MILNLSSRKPKDYVSRKVKKRNCYSVKNGVNKKVFSKCTSKINACKQIRLLRAIRYNKTFTPFNTYAVVPENSLEEHIQEPIDPIDESPNQIIKQKKRKTRKNQKRN